VTILFADLKGSMELLADHDPEEARKILDAVLELMMEIPRFRPLREPRSRTPFGRHRTATSRVAIRLGTRTFPCISKSSKPHQ